jgi:DNA processing protein
VRGDPGALLEPCVAVVGPRAPSATGRAVARRFGTELARARVAVVSGLATGIDAVAHLAALDEGGVTVAVQACGPDRVYPAHHRRLAERIATRGAVVTEFPVGTPPLPAYFPLRNRLISALSHAVVVVEARVRSGSLVTARHAADQGVDVFAVPGPVDVPTSAGTNRLLRSGAAVALEPADVLDELRRARVIGRQARPVSHRARSEPVSAEAREILDALLREPVSREELVRKLARAPERLEIHLLELELAGWIAQDRDGRLRALPREA